MGASSILPVLRFLRSKKLETVPGAGTLPVWGTGGAKRPRPPEAKSRRSHAAFAAGGSACPFGQQTLCATRPDFQSGSGSWAHSAQLSPTATRPATCRCGKSPLDRIQPILIPPVLRFLLSKKLETVPGAGTLPVWGTGGRSAPGRRRLSPPPALFAVRQRAGAAGEVRGADRVGELAAVAVHRQPVAVLQ